MGMFFSKPKQEEKVDEKPLRFKYFKNTAPAQPKPKKAMKKATKKVVSKKKVTKKK